MWWSSTKIQRLAPNSASIYRQKYGIKVGSKQIFKHKRSLNGNIGQPNLFKKEVLEIVQIQEQLQRQKPQWWCLCHPSGPLAALSELPPVPTDASQIRWMVKNSYTRIICVYQYKFIPLYIYIYIYIYIYNVSRLELAGWRWVGNL